MKAILPFAMLLGALAACGSNETETRVASACETAFVDQPGERSTFDSITTICGCFGKDTHHNEGSNYLGRMERAMADITQRRQERGISWPDAYVALERDYAGAGDEDGLEGLEDVLYRLSKVDTDLEDGRCEGGLASAY